MKSYEVLIDLNSLRFVVQAENEEEAEDMARKLAMETLDPWDALKWAEAQVEDVTE